MASNDPSHQSGNNYQHAREQSFQTTFTDDPRTSFSPNENEHGKLLDLHSDQQQQHVDPLERMQTHTQQRQDFNSYDSQNSVKRHGGSNPHQQQDDDDAADDERRQQQHDMTIMGDSTEKSPSFDELFFDLLFAASLNTYSNNVQLSHLGAVAGFLAYFALLWWAWWGQTYFDVRFRRPEHNRPFMIVALQRFVRLALLGIWVAFSTTPSEFVRNGFANFSAVYGSTRIALALDHVIILVDLTTRKNADAKNQSQSAFSIIRQHWTHLLSINACCVSAVLWITSRYQNKKNEVEGPLIIMWLCGVLVEVVSQIIIEWFGNLQPLGQTILPERMCLFGLIILGEGFNGIGDSLNKISPGSKRETLDGKLASGGWGILSIVQAGASVLIIVLNFYAYFHRAVKEIEARSLVIVIWAYIHIFVHMASALTVIGLKKIISFLNAYSALSRFINNPERYLPDGRAWNNVTPDVVYDLYESASPSPFQISNYQNRSIAAILSVLQSTDGADIPSVEQANGLVDSVQGLVGGPNAVEYLLQQANKTGADEAASSSFDKALVIPFQSYFDFADNVLNPDSLDEYIEKSLFQFTYLYLACGAYLLSDVVAKILQANHDRSKLSFQLSMVTRFLFAAILFLVQLIYNSTKAQFKSNVALEGALSFCAVILLVELLVQCVIDRLSHKIDRSNVNLIGCCRRRKPNQSRDKINSAPYSPGQDNKPINLTRLDSSNRQGQADPERQVTPKFNAF